MDRQWRRTFFLSLAICFILFSVFRAVLLVYIAEQEKVTGEPNYNCTICTTVPPDYSP